MESAFLDFRGVVNGCRQVEASVSPGCSSDDVIVCLEDRTHPGTGRGSTSLQLKSEDVVLRNGWVCRAPDSFVV